MPVMTSNLTLTKKRGTLQKANNQMCLILISPKSHPSYKLIIAGNRDEYYNRPTAPATFWEKAPDLLAGKDLRAGGTWFGITRQGRIAVITDYRNPALTKSQAPSRGELVRDFLLSRENPVDYLQKLTQKAGEYNGFNLMVGKTDHLYYYSNIEGKVKNIKSRVYGLSNHLLDTPWPKVISRKNAFIELISKGKPFSPESLFTILSDRSVADDTSLPHTGIDIEWERILSSTFISTPTYGTRSSTLLLITPDDQVTFIERSYSPEADHTTVRHEFRIESCR